jgi:pyrimidine-specific ribonucleoside hydrolase
VIPVLMDCDPGQDDAIALLLVVASPELELLGVTTVAGNQALDKVTRNALRVLELAGRTDVPVVAGADRPLVRELVVAAEAHGESGLDGPALPPPRARPLARHAVEFLAEQALASDHPVTLVATGPLTNVALFLAQRPDAAARLGRIVLMGGSSGAGNMTPSAEFNVWVDPEAAARVFKSGLDITMVGLDVTNQAALRAEDAEALRETGPVGAAVREMLAFYGRFYREWYRFEGAPIHDAVAVAHLIRPDLVTTREHHVAVELGSGLCRGRTVVDTRLRRVGVEPPNARVAVGIDAASFADFLVGRLAQLSRERERLKP